MLLLFVAAVLFCKLKSNVIICSNLKCPCERTSLHCHIHFSLTCGNPHGPSLHRGLQRSDVQESNQLKPHGESFCALDRMDPGAALIVTSGPLSTPACTDAGIVSC